MRTLCIALIGLALAARPAPACDFDVGFPPSNFELVAHARVVAVADAVDAHALAIVDVIRGTGIAPGVRVTADVDADPTPARKLKPSLDFSDTGGYDTGCRRHFARGHRYIVFLDQATNGTWFARDDLASRINIEVDPAGDPWTTAVTEYALIAALPPSAQRAALDMVVAKGQDKGASALDRAIASDVAQHFATPSRFKSAAELEQIALTGTGWVRPTALSLLGELADPASRSFMLKIIDGIIAGKVPVEIDMQSMLSGPVMYFAKVPDDTVVDTLGAFYFKTDAINRWPIVSLLGTRAEPRHQDLVERALERATDDQAAELAKWFADHPSKRALANIRKRLGGAYADMFAFKLRQADAMVGDDGVIRWATSILAGRSRRDVRDDAIIAIGLSPLPEADAATAQIIANRGDDLGMLLFAYRQARHAHVDARLAEIAALPNLAASTRTAVDEIIKRRKAGP